MRVITAITPQVKDAKRCNIFLDGEFFCGMTLEAVMKNRLRVGASVTEEQLEQIQLQNERSAALDKALNHLTASVKTVKQIRDFLRDKGYTPTVINYVVDKLKEYGFLSDEDYARRFTETYSNKKGVKLMRVELRRKGVAEEIVDGVLDDVGSQAEAAAVLAKKYMKGKEADLKTVQKLYRHLLSKGFTYDDARTAVMSVTNEDLE